MNTKGIKFLTVLAVLAMAFAVVAVTVDSEKSDAADPVISDLDLDLTLNGTEGTTGNVYAVTYDSATGIAKITGVVNAGVTGLTGVYSSDSNYVAAEWSVAYLTGFEAGMYYNITQYNTALKVFVAGGSAETSGNTAVRTTAWQADNNHATFSENGVYAFLIPKDGTNVTLQIRSATTAELAETAAPTVITIDCTKVSTQIPLAATAITPTGETGWTYTSGVLTLNNYTGSTLFDYSAVTGSLAIHVAGTNTITSYGMAKAIALKGEGKALTIDNEVASSTSDDSLTIAVPADAYGIDSYSTSSVTIEQKAVATYGKLTVSISGGNRAIDTGVLTIAGGATVNATGSEVGVRVRNATGSLTVTDSTLNASLDGTLNTNGDGTESIFGIRATGPITITKTDADNNAVVTTQGLSLEKTTGDLIVNTGILYVTGGYTQKSGYASGLFNGGNTLVFEKVASASGGEATKNYLVGDAEAFGLVTVNSGTAKEQEIVTSAADIATSTAPKIVANISGTVAETIPIAATKTVQFIATSNLTATVDVDGQTFKMTNFQGSVKIIKGSIDLEAESWSSGTITLKDGEVLKISGKSVTGDVKIDFEGTGSATVLLEEKKSFTIDSGSLTIDSDKITTDVYGLVVIKKTATFTNKGLLNVYGAIQSEAGGASGKVENAGTGAIVVYSGADVSKTIFADGTIPSGSDGDDGVWTYDGTTFTLKGYNGTYTFGAFAANADITTIIIEGENIVTYAPETIYDGADLFGGVKLTDVKSVLGGGELSVVVDLSDVEDGAKLAPTTACDIFHGKTTGKLAFDGVVIAVELSGSNSAWTATQVSAAKFNGIFADEVTFYNSSLIMDVLSSYSAENTNGIKADGLDVRSCAMFTVKSAGTAIALDGDVEDATIKETIALIGGNAAGIIGGDVLTVSNGSAAMVTPSATFGKIDVSQGSTLDVTDLTLTAAGSINYGKIITKGNTIITSAASLTNHALFENEGIIGVYGTLVTDDGTFTNSGKVHVYAKDVPAITAPYNTITFADTVATTNTTAMVKTITLDVTPAELKRNADGSFDVKATATYVYKGGDIIPTAESSTYTGKLTPTQSDADDKFGYTLALSNSYGSITVVYDANKTGGPKVDVDYKVTVAGSVVNSSGTAKYLEVNAKNSGVTDATVNSAGNELIKLLTASLTVSGGEMINGEDASVVLFDGVTPITGNETEFTGNLTTYTANTTIGGIFTGDLTANGSGTATIDGKLTGNITAKKAVVIGAEGMFVGGIITAGGAVTINGSAIGEVIMNDSSNSLDFTLKGSMIGNLTYKTKYKSTTTALLPDVEFSATLAIGGFTDGSTNGLVITANKGDNATTTTAAYGGFFVLKTLDILGEDGAIGVAVTEGKLAVNTLLTMPAGYVIGAEDGTTFEVAKNVVFTVDGALTINDGATANFETVAIPTTYGKVVYAMTFHVSEGYTVYSNVAYALSNCDENTEMAVGTDATMTDNVSLKAGVNVIVATGKTLAFGAYGLSMGEGAKITLEGTGKITFAATGIDTAEDGSKTARTVSGTVVYDDDNVLKFEGVRFDAPATIAGVAATSTADSKFNVALVYDEGGVAILQGTVAGTIDLKNDNYTLNTIIYKVSGKFGIAPGAISEATITDMAKSGTGDAEKPVTKVLVDGIMKVSAGLTINGTYSGEGYVFLANGIAATVKATTTLEFGNGIDGFELNKAQPDGSYIITAVAASGSTAAYVQISGAVKNGTVTASGNTASGALTLGHAKTATTETTGALIIPEGATLTVLNGNDLTANGLLKNAGTLNYYTTTTTSYGKVIHEITYEEAAYTVYTKLQTAFDVAPEGTDIVISNSTLAIGDTTIPTGVSITIADGYYLTVTAGKYLIIGEPDTSLGAGEIISGNIVLGVGAYIVDYAGSGSDITVYTDPSLASSKIAPNNAFIVMDNLFATVYAYDSTMVLNNGAAINLTLLKPEFEGFYFNQWALENGNFVAPGVTALADGPFVASMVASKVTVTFKTFEGIDYYVDGIIQNILDAPIKVDYGTMVTAKISDISKFKGTPLVNGKAYVVVDNTVSSIVGSGVEPIPEPPQPEPEPVEENTGLTLTDILLIVLVVLIAIMVVILVLRLNRS